jgi:hypothetical protein
MVKPPPQLSMPLCWDGHQNPALTQILLRGLWLCLNCSGARKEAGHQWGDLGVILELPQMQELPKRTLHEKGRQYSLAGRWVRVAGGAVIPSRCPRNVRR